MDCSANAFDDDPVLIVSFCLMFCFFAQLLATMYAACRYILRVPFEKKTRLLYDSSCFGFTGVVLARGTDGGVGRETTYLRTINVIFLDGCCMHLHIQPFKVGCSHGIHCIPLSPLVSSKKRVSD